jgi:curli production assembly/transport component CsgG
VFRLALFASALAAAALVSGCAYTPQPAIVSKLPVYPNMTSSTAMLEDLPRAEAPVAVAVYGFNDETGQFKPSNLGQTLSRAVSQGGSAMLVRSLMETGNRGWFTIVEREQLKDLLNERQIIRDQRAQYLGEKTVNPQALPALLFAGVLLEGGIVGYDTNTLTGGVGATMLGIGGDAKYQQDTVTVYLRAVSVKTGEVLSTVTASKTVTSYAVDINVFRYVSSDSILETENGFTTNEPELVALQQAIDKAVYGMVMEGVDLKLWNFADPTAGAPYLQRYHDERDGVLSSGQVIAREKAEHQGNFGRPAPTPPAPTATSMNTPAIRPRAPAALASNAPTAQPTGQPLAAAKPPTAPNTAPATAAPTPQAVSTSGVVMHAPSAAPAVIAPLSSAAPTPIAPTAAAPIQTAANNIDDVLASLDESSWPSGASSTAATPPQPTR